MSQADSANNLLFFSNKKYILSSNLAFFLEEKEACCINKGPTPFQNFFIVHLETVVLPEETVSFSRTKQKENSGHIKKSLCPCPVAGGVV